MNHDETTEQEIPLETATAIIADALNAACWDICLDAKVYGSRVKIRNVGTQAVGAYEFKPLATRQEIIDAARDCAEFACHFSGLANRAEVRDRVVQDAVAEVERLLDAAPVHGALVPK